MSVRFARPNVANLAFQLYGRSVHPELFEVFAECKVRQSAYAAVIQICHTGHRVAFRFGESTITEVTTTSDQPLPQRKRLLDQRFCGNRTESFQFQNGLKYHASFQLERLEPENYLSFHEELLLDCNRVEVFHRFPAGNRLSPEPLSLIRTDVNAESLLIHAYHTFPESCSVVKTQSLFEF